VPERHRLTGNAGSARNGEVGHPVPTPGSTGPAVQLDAVGVGGVGPTRPPWQVAQLATLLAVEPDCQHAVFEGQVQDLPFLIIQRPLLDGQGQAASPRRNDPTKVIHLIAAVPDWREQ
jgi:hypothetical protein